MSELSSFQAAWRQLLTQRLEEELRQLDSGSELEEAVHAYLNYLARFSEDLGRPVFRPLPVRPGDWPEAYLYNDNFRQGQETVRLLLRWLKGLGDAELERHNYLLAQYLGLKTQVKRLAGVVADLELFQKDTAAGVRIYGDTFTTTDKVDNISRRDWPQALVDLHLGAVTLPVEGTIQLPQIASIKVNPWSNGVPGNNQQLGVTSAHNDITVIADGRLDTWYEYEAVSLTPRSQPLILDFTISFVRETLLNRLQIYLNNLGGTAWPRLQDLQTSLDGKNFASLRGEVRASSQKLDLSDLEPLATSNGGLLVLYFPPRRVRHLRLIFQQSGYFFVRTGNGERYRYAIGLREVAASGIVYQKIGELLSRPFRFSRPIRRVMLETEEVLPAGACRIQHFLSPDGETWQELQPAAGLRADLPKVLSFEDRQVTSLVYRAVLIRDEGSEAERALSQYALDITEFLPFPTSPPYTLDLSKTPEPESVSVYLPYAGSAGLEAKFCLGTSDGAADQFFSVPFPLQGDEEVWVNKQLWRRTDSLRSSAADARVYAVDYTSQSIVFGDGVHGMIPPAGFRVYLALPPERLLVTGGEVPTASLRHAALPQSLKIYRVGQPKTVNQELLARGATVLRLSHQNLLPEHRPVFTGAHLEAFVAEKAFVDGSTELSAPGDYSVDYRRGIIFTKRPTPVNSNCYVSYRYVPREPLNDAEWELVPGTANVVEISPEAFHSEEAVQEDLRSQAGSLLVNLAHSHLIRGRFRFSAQTGLDKELPFIDGVSEFAGITLQQDESVPAGVVLFTLEHVPRQDYQVVFSDTVVFAREVSSLEAVNFAGAYWIDYATGEVHTYLPTNGGRVSYYYHHDLSDLERSYSVDYEKGQVHLYRPLPGLASATYQYAHYEAEYCITEPIPAAAYELRPADRQIALTDVVLINNLRQRYAAEDVVAVSYRYLVQEAAGSRALQMTTPLLQSYGLRLLFEGDL